MNERARSLGTAPAGVRAIAFEVNGEARRVLAPAASRLADALRDELGLTGTKIGCNAGDCGACTVLLDGRQVCACLVALGQVEGRAVTTVEGLAAAGKLDRLQHAFLAHGAAQCGICTPGMLMAATELLARNPRPTEPEALDALGGVLCRCTGYRKIVEAVLAAAADGVQPRSPRRGGRSDLAPRRRTGSRKSPGPSATLPTPRPRVRSGCGPSARRTPGHASRSAISGRCALRIRGWSTSSPRATCR